MMRVAFHKAVPDELLQFAVIAVRHAGKWAGREPTLGMLYSADIDIRPTARYEMASICCMDILPRWTYPEIQPKLLERAKIFLSQYPEF